MKSFCKFALNIKHICSSLNKYSTGNNLLFMNKSSTRKEAESEIYTWRTKLTPAYTNLDGKVIANNKHLKHYYQIK